LYNKLKVVGQPKSGKLRIKQYQKYLDSADRFEIALNSPNQGRAFSESVGRIPLCGGSDGSLFQESDPDQQARAISKTG
jgi:hypothetical protein